MAKSKLSEVLTLNVEGTLNTETMNIEIEDIGTKELKDLFSKFNGELVKISVKLGNEITE